MADATAKQAACIGCQRPMVSQPVWWEDPEGWKARGFVKHNGRGLCNTCYTRARRGGQLGSRPAKRTTLTAPVLDAATIARLRAAVGLEVTCG